MIELQLDSGGLIDVIYTDFAKAFDTVPNRSSALEVMVREAEYFTKFYPSLPALTHIKENPSQPFYEKTTTNIKYVWKII